jgi:hypothetical protein
VPHLQRRGHSAHACRASKDETAPASQASSGATAQPETQPTEADGPHTVVEEGKGSWIAEKGAAHAQNVNVELDLSRALPQTPTLEVHARMAVAEPDPRRGKPDAI